MEDKIITTAAPTASERKSLRLMIFIGVFAVGFFLYSMLQRSNISYFPLYVLLMITLFYYVFKFLHEWYHYFSISYHPPPAATRSYTVDIFTTFCAGEPFDMLEETLTAMQKIRYPHTSWCCDEADDPQVKALCARLGVQHVTRTIKKDAKAGNINNALQYATGEICLVLDPDHVPVPGIIDEIIGYFEDPGIGFVQIVQAYYNQTETMVAKGAAQQTYQFYGPVMMTMNTYGTVQAIGANCTFRRAALDSIGGHASGLAEDMHTAMQMHAKGWRSVYHPAILTRGLVPATMSSYYKQQLKWSRGTWELFLMVFPKLFSKFTWRQRLHYFTLPFHYLSGLIFLINFLIPVVSLCTGYIPLQMDILSFMLAAFPLFCMGMFIRHYVQKWVAEETERGFHVVGGILQIGTWWIHSVGLVYTLFRKKVPYIPTPKNDHDSLPLRLSMPNILVALISFAAIVYGFWHDYTPYTVFMAVLAFMQIVFMVFIFSISGYVRENSKLNHIATKIKEKNGLIIRTHGFVRKYSVPLSIAVIIFFVFGYIEKQRLPAYLPKPLPQLQLFYRGTSIGGEEPATEAANRLLPAMLRNDVSIVSMIMERNAEGISLPDTAAIKKISASGALPLLQWSISANPARQDDTATLQAIAAGQFDSSIYKLARQLADLQQPIFFQPMIPAPVSDSDVAVTQRTRTQYLQAWQHLHSLFAAAGANQVIWVWSIPATDSAAQYFPGRAMADWAAVQFTAFDAARYANQPAGFDSLYRSVHRLPLIKRSALPVMVQGLTAAAAYHPLWWPTAWKTIDTGFTEIKAMVIDAKSTASGSRPNAPALQKQLGDVFAGAPLSAKWLPQVAAMAPGNSNSVLRTLPDTLKNVVYNKGLYWFRNRHTLNIRTIEEDIDAMKAAGINTVERRMPGFYDDKLQTVLLKKNLQLLPSFWLLPTPAVIGDSSRMKEEAAKIIDFIKQNKSAKNIIAWHLGEDRLYALSNQSYKPDYFYYEQRYLAWLSALCKAIRAIDERRPIVVDLHWDDGGQQRFQLYKKAVPEIDQYLLEADEKYPEGLKLPLSPGMAWGKVPVALWPLLPVVKKSATVPAWQDIANTNFISLNGLLDMDGRKKDSWVTVMNTWSLQHVAATALPETRILRPATFTEENETLNYHLVFKKNGAYWQDYPATDKNIHFEWYLVRVDQYGNTMFIKKISEGNPYIDLTMPNGPQYYRLYAEVILGDRVRMVHASLNTPLE